MAKKPDEDTFFELLIELLKAHPIKVLGATIITMAIYSGIKITLGNGWCIGYCPSTSPVPTKPIHIEPVPDLISPVGMSEGSIQFLLLGEDSSVSITTTTDVDINVQKQSPEYIVSRNLEDGRQLIIDDLLAEPLIPSLLNVVDEQVINENTALGTPLTSDIMNNVPLKPLPLLTEAQSTESVPEPNIFLGLLISSGLIFSFIKKGKS